EVSTPGSNAGQGAAHATGALVTSLFYVRVDEHRHELWGAALDCAR
ncbi:MAG: hypothetical protein FJ104_01625, partial [Deltaproteobacteria bacterium]|nr:hypothetical protein [Deltaproteobacteria bacterium]